MLLIVVLLVRFGLGGTEKNLLGIFTRNVLRTWKSNFRIEADVGVLNKKDARSVILKNDWK